MTGQRDIGLERQDGYDVGRDPRTMTMEDLEQLGHARVSPLRALRLKCLDCCNGSAREVRLCTAVDCPSWPFRTGKNPWRRALTDEERVERQARFAGKSPAAPSEAQNSGGEIRASHPGRGKGPEKPASDSPAGLLEEGNGGAS